MNKFRVVDLRVDLVVAEQTVEASTPEEAARQVLGEDVARGGQSRHLLAKVYIDGPVGKTTMIRMYAKA